MYKIFCGFLLLSAISFGTGWQNVDELYEHLKAINLVEKQDNQVKILLKQYYRDLKDWWVNNKKINDKILDDFGIDGFLEYPFEDELKKSYTAKAKIDLNFLKQLYNILTQEQRKKLMQSFTRSD